MIDLSISNQPDDETCGPTCLHAVYQYYGLPSDLNDLITQVERSRSGGTLAPWLGKHALEKKLNATIYVNSLDVFDPTWFKKGLAVPEELMAKLTTQLQYKKDPGIVQLTNAYLEFLQFGGEIRFKTISVPLLKEYFKKKIPILTGLSATYLYGCARESYTKDGIAVYDDIQGTPCGHFVVLCGYDDKKKHIVVADPHRQNPLSHNNYYKVTISRLINAIMLGVLTHDGNLLIINPQRM